MKAQLTHNSSTKCSTVTGSSLGMAIATWSVMEHYAWKHATILLDANSFTNLYSQFAETLLRASRSKRITGISLSLISIKQITEANLVKSLKTAQLQSRGPYNQCILTRIRSCQLFQNRTQNRREKPKTTRDISYAFIVP